MSEHEWGKQEVEEGAVETAPETEELDEEQQALMAIYQLYSAARSSGNWFYWVAGLSVVNTIIALADGGWFFALGLGATLVLDSIIIEEGRQSAILVLPMIAIVLGIFCMFGFFAGRAARWAFIVGMIVYALDTIIMLLMQAWIGFVFHLYVLYVLSQGLKAAGILDQIKKETVSEAVEHPRRELDKKSADDLYRNPRK